MKINEVGSFYSSYWIYRMIDRLAYAHGSVLFYCIATDLILSLELCPLSLTTANFNNFFFCSARCFFRRLSPCRFWCVISFTTMCKYITYYTERKSLMVFGSCACVYRTLHHSHKGVPIEYSMSLSAGSTPLYVPI